MPAIVVVMEQEPRFSEGAVPQKRGGGAQGCFLVTFGDARDETTSSEQELLALDDALTDLERVSPRQAFMVESRFFGGLDISETAALLGVSEATSLRDWRVARAWLAHEVRRGR